MPTISFSGLATGLDTGSIITQLMAIRRQPIVRLENRKSGFERQLGALADLKTKLLAFQQAAEALDTPGEFGALAVSSTDEARVSATASSLAAPGSYQVIVHNLATAQKELSQGYDSMLTNVGTGSITLTVGGEATVINLEDPVNTLASLRDAINDAGVGVSATILNDGSAEAPYRLILSATETGSSGAFTADLSGLSGGTDVALTNLSTAQDASLEIDSVPVVSSSNSLSEAISGVTLNLLAADPDTTVTVSLQTDAEAIQENVQGFVDAYNDLFAFIVSQSADDGTLRGHPTLQNVARRIENLVSSPLSTGTGDLNMLAFAGISQGEGRQLVFDTQRFALMLSEDYASVRDLFVERGDNLGKAYLLRLSVDDLTDSVDGLFKISTDSLNDKIGNVEDTIARYERSLDSYEAYLQQRFTAMESLVATFQAQSNYLSQFSSILS